VVATSVVDSSTIYDEVTNDTSRLPTNGKPTMRSSIRPLNDFRDAAVAQFLARLRTVWLVSWPQSIRRTTRPWAALVVVPILMVLAAMTLHFWLVVVLAALCWWWGSKDDPWMWVLSILEAVWGLQWGAVGLYFLVAYPGHRALVSVLWIAYALAIAGIGAVNRWRGNRRFGI